MTGTGTALSAFSGSGTVTPISTDVAAVFNASKPIVLLLPIDVAGRVVDDTTGQPIVGARVVISQSAVIAGATPPPASATPWPTATTAADGSFGIRNVKQTTFDANFGYVGAGYPDYPNAQWVQIFSSDGHTAYHALWSVNAGGTTNLGSIGVAMPTANDTAWLASINHDRATIGTPVETNPLTLDSVTMETARYWAGQMASYGFYAHQCATGDTACQAFWLFETQNHSLPSSQNIDYGGAETTYQNAESAFMAEVASCPGGAWMTCTYAENTGHFINIMSATYWAGLGTATGKDPTSRTGTTSVYFVQDFTTPTNFSNAIQSLRRSLEIP